MLNQLKRLILAFILMTVSITVGVVGYMIIENYTLLNAFYMVIVTISTVGFREVEPLSQTGKIFTSFYIISNLLFFCIFSINSCQVHI
jgi:voltage-gated potassium channel